MIIKRFNPNGVSVLEEDSGNEIRVKFIKAGGPYEYAVCDIDNPERIWTVQFVGTNKADDISTWCENDLIILGHRVK